MSAGSITGMTIIVALLGVLVVGLLTYMSSLVRRAYELKVELHGEIDRGLRQIESDIEMRSRKMRQDVHDDMGKLKEALKQGVEQRHQETLATLDGTLAAYRDQQDKALGDHARVIEDLRRRQKALQRDLETVALELGRLTGEPAPRLTTGKTPPPEKPASSTGNA